MARQNHNLWQPLLCLPLLPHPQPTGRGGEGGERRIPDAAANAAKLIFHVVDRNYLFIIARGERRRRRRSNGRGDATANWNNETTRGQCNKRQLDNQLAQREARRVAQ
jgi:hypothetical protein